MKLLPIEIFSVYLLNEKIKNRSSFYSHCISIMDPGELDPPMIHDHFEEVLTLRFHDINKLSELPSEENPCTPKMKDIDKIIKFYNRTYSCANGYTVHCHAGVHRSVATGMMLLYLMNNSNEYVYNEILKVKAFPLPNKRMIKLFDKRMTSKLYELGPILDKRIIDFLKGKIQVNLDDYLEELDVVD